MAALALAALVPSLVLPAAPAAPARAAPRLRRLTTTTMAAIEPTQAAAEAQRREYYAMAPWEKMPQLLPKSWGRPTTLDTRMFIQPFNRSGVVTPGLFVYQEGFPGVQAGAGRERFWRPVGAISALAGSGEGEDANANVPAAVARQRDLIVAWADEVCVDLKTGKKLLRLGPVAPPIQLAWAYKQSIADWAMYRLSRIGEKDDAYEGELNVVPQEQPFDDSDRCGFLGTSSRPVKTERGLLSFTKVALP